MRNFFDNNTERLYITYCYKSATTQEKMFENIQFPSVEWNQCLQLKSQQKNIILDNTIIRSSPMCFKKNIRQV